MVAAVVPFSLLLLLSIVAMVATAAAYTIGTPGVKWGIREKMQWKDSRRVHRSYKQEVLDKIYDNTDLEESPFVTHQYGTLKVDDTEFPLVAIKSKTWSSSKPSLLVTGGVHGYETSGVQGAIQFLFSMINNNSDFCYEYDYSKIFNILVVPCVSPWGYERIERWNAQAVDPNRSFNRNGCDDIVEGRSFNPEPPTPESTALIQYLDSFNDGDVDHPWICHIDLHETTDTDKTEFRPAKRARDGIILSTTTTTTPMDDNDDQKPEKEEGQVVAAAAEPVVDPDAIPDGFYLVSDSTNPQSEWHEAMIQSVKKVTHIAPTEADGTIIGETVVQEGVISIPAPKSLGLCSGVTNAPYATTTEVYPDSKTATPQQCNDAQVACIVGGLNFLIKERNLEEQ